MKINHSYFNALQTNLHNIYNIIKWMHLDIPDLYFVHSGIMFMNGYVRTLLFGNVHGGPICTGVCFLMTSCYLNFNKH